MAQEHRAGATAVGSPPGATRQRAAQLPRSSMDLLLPQPWSRMDLAKVRACPACSHLTPDSSRERDTQEQT